MSERVLGSLLLCCFVLGLVYISSTVEKEHIKKSNEIASQVEVQSDGDTLSIVVTDTVAYDASEVLTFVYKGETMKFFGVKSYRIVATDSSTTVIFLETKY